MNEKTEIVEINGVKFEVNMSQAKKVQHFKVGDAVKVLVKDYERYKAHIGTVVGFDWFEKMPTIRIAYLNVGYNNTSIKFIDYNSATEETEISPLNSIAELDYDKATIIRSFNKEIENKEHELRDLTNQKEMFERTFGKYFNQAVEPKHEFA